MLAESYVLSSIHSKNSTTLLSIRSSSIAAVHARCSTMGIGTLIRVPDMVREISPDNTRDSIERPSAFPEEQLRQQMLERRFGRELYFREPNTYYADTGHFNSILSSDYMFSTSVSEWGPNQPEPHKTPSTIWDSAKLIELLEKPLGSPIELTLE